MTLLARNKLASAKNSPPIVPISTVKEFEIPAKYLNDPNKPRAVTSWWYHCLRETKRTTQIPYVAQMRPAKKLLMDYELEEILLAIRRVFGWGRYAPSLFWLIKNPDKAGLKLKRDNGRKITFES